MTEPNKDGDHQALRVTFKDGTMGLVGISITFAADPNRAADIISTYGTQKNAIAELTGAVVAATYKLLETRTISEARQNRTDIERAVLNLTTNIQKQTGHSIQRFSILEIDSAK